MTIKEFFEKKEKLAIHCDTEEKANKLLRKFDELGKKWCDNESYLKNNDWDTYQDETCYSNQGNYARMNTFKQMNYKIIEFDDLDNFKGIFTKNDLKNRMVAECRNGKRFMIVDDCLIGIDVFFDKDYFDNDLNPLYPDAKEWDIIKVFAQHESFGFGFEKSLYEDDLNHLIWERKEEILTKEEKEYLANVIKPVKEKVLYVLKTSCINKDKVEMDYISIDLKSEYTSHDYIQLYFFSTGTQFVGMKEDKEYTLEELGLN